MVVASDRAKPSRRFNAGDKKAVGFAIKAIHDLSVKGLTPSLYDSTTVCLLFSPVALPCPDSRVALLPHNFYFRGRASSQEEDPSIYVSTAPNETKRSSLAIIPLAMGPCCNTLHLANQFSSSPQAATLPSHSAPR